MWEPTQCEQLQWSSQQQSLPSLKHHLLYVMRGQLLLFPLLYVSTIHTLVIVIIFFYFMSYTDERIMIINCYIVISIYNTLLYVNCLIFYYYYYYYCGCIVIAVIPLLREIYRSYRRNQRYKRNFEHLQSQRHSLAADIEDSSKSVIMPIN